MSEASEDGAPKKRTNPRRYSARERMQRELSRHHWAVRIIESEPIKKPHNYPVWRSVAASKDCARLFEAIEEQDMFRANKNKEIDIDGMRLLLRAFRAAGADL